MSTLNAVYRKFGETSEAAQLLETEFGNLLLEVGGIESDLFNNPNPEVAIELMTKINRQTLGQLIRNAKIAVYSVNELETILSEAQSERNRLAHTFYRQHNFRRNSEEGCQIMMADLEKIHHKILEAYKAILLLSGIDIEKIELEVPIKHVKI